MITHIFGSQRKLNQALAQGRLVKVEKCFSGLLGSAPLYRRLALTTGPAFNALETDPGLRDRLLNEITATNLVSDQPFEGSHGISFVLYNGKTFGLRLADSVKDETDYQEAEEGVQNRFYRKGPNRRILLATWGISAPTEVDSLPPLDFGAILVKLATVAHDPQLSKTYRLELTDGSFDSVQSSSDGSLLLTLSRAKLSEVTLSPRTLLGTEPVLPAARPNFLESIGSLWRKFFGA